MYKPFISQCHCTLIKCSVPLFSVAAWYYDIWKYCGIPFLSVLFTGGVQKCHLVYFHLGSDILLLLEAINHVPLSVCLSVPAVCGCDLARSGFFQKSGEYICTEDYQRLYGTQCDSCGEFITGEVVSALGRTYHPKCFVCSQCRYCTARNHC